MIFDNTLLFSDDQAITADAVSTNVVDLGAPGTVYGAAAAIGHDKGPGNPIPLLIQVTETFDNLTNLIISVESSADEAFTSPQSTVIGDELLAALVAGKKMPFHIWPRDMAGRYVRLDYDVVGTNPTAGKITAGVVADTDNR